VHAIKLCKNLQIVGHFVYPYLSIQLIRVRLANRDVTDTHATDTLGRNSSCLGLTTRDATDTHEANTVGRKWWSSLLTAGRNSSYLGVDNSGRNWYTWSRHRGTQII